MTSLFAQVAGAPAGGAEVTQVAIATSAALLLTAVLVYLGQGHRSGRVKLLGRLGDRAEALTGLPAWTSLPSGIATISLITAATGLYWDVSLHIDNGRDAGPLANPSHYLILGGLFGIFSAGWLAMALGDERPGPAAVRITRDWHVPVGGLLLVAAASFALLGFPLDDVSHRLFGQDVTLWGPTHLMMLGGAAMSLIGILTLLTEARLARESAPAARARSATFDSPLMRRLRLVSACGGLLIAMSIFQGEFDYGVPQFRLLFHPALIALAAGTALVLARVVGGRGTALGAVAFFLVIRGGLTVLVGPVLGETVAHFPLYVVEALIVEAVALKLTTDRPYRFAVVAGALVGTVGVVAEYSWSHVWMPLPWPAHMLPAAVVVGSVMAIAGGVLGAFAGGALRVRPEVSGTRRALAIAGVSLVAVAATTGYLLRATEPRASVTVNLDQAGEDRREANAIVRVEPASAARDADWLTVTAWQGGERLHVDRLEPLGEGVYRTTEPMPVNGTWKTMVRLHNGSELGAAAVRLPADPAIPAAGVAAADRFERALIADRDVLQRERKKDVPGWLWGAAGAVVLILTLLLLGGIGWALFRVCNSAGGPAQPTKSRRARSVDQATGYPGGVPAAGRM